MGLILFSGCAQPSAHQEIIKECDSLCRVDADAYCEQNRTIQANGVSVTGTCRSFSRKGNVPGFNKCEGFCKEYDKSGVFCYVNGEKDEDCDGIIE